MSGLLAISAAALVVAVAAALQSAVGFGFSLIAGPLLFLIDPRLVPGPTLVGLLLLALVQSGREWRNVDRRGLTYALVGKLPGTAAGLLALASLSTATLGVVTGLSVLLAVTASLTVRCLAPTRGLLLLAGVASGFGDSTSSIGGPPVALVYRRSPPAVLRATLAAYFVAGVSITILSLGLSGHFTADSARMALPLLPAVLVGTVLANPVRRALGARTAEAVIALSVVSALLVLARSISALG